MNFMLQFKRKAKNSPLFHENGLQARLFADNLFTDKKK